MQIIEYEDVYCFERECAKIAVDANTFEVDIDEGVSASFERTKNNKYQLLDVAFDKEVWNFDDAEDFWNTYNIMCYQKKNSLNKLIPLCDDIVETEEGELVCIYPKDEKQKETIEKQLEMLDSDMLVVRGSDDDLIWLMKDGD